MAHSNPVVRFYLLPAQADLDERLNFTCQLVEKAFQERLKTIVVCPDEDIANQLDQKLWSLKRESFIPHCFLADEISQKTPVVISTPAERIAYAEVQIDLSYELRPDTPRGCGRILEIISQQEEVLRSSRVRFGLYKERGWQPQVHQLPSN